MSQRKRYVYSIEELRRLRPPPSSPPLQPSPVQPLRSAPLSIPRRPSPSPIRSPQNARSRAQSLSSSPPSGAFLPPSSYDGSTLVMNLHVNTRSPSPLLPPGFGPPRSHGNGKANSNGSTQGRVGERRIARGPNLANNFASRIAFASARKQRKQQQPQPPINSIPASKSQPVNLIHEQKQHRPQRALRADQPVPIHQQISRRDRDYELSSEIDRLFADEAPVSLAVPTAHNAQSNTRNDQPLTDSRSYGQGLTRQSSDSDFNVPRGPSPLEDAAVTLASVAYFPSSGTDSNGLSPLMSEEPKLEQPQTQPIADITFEDFAKQLAAGAQSRVVERENDGADLPVPVQANVSKAEASPQAVTQAPVPAGVQNEAATVAAEAAAADAGKDPTVDALAKWFSSLAAGVDTGGTAQVEKNVDVKAKVVVEEEKKVVVETEEMEAEEEEEKGLIDERITGFFSRVWKRAVDGDMMEWAQQFENDDYVEIDLEVDDLMEADGGFNGDVGAGQGNGPVASSEGLESMMSSMAGDVADGR